MPEIVSFVLMIIQFYFKETRRSFFHTKKAVKQWIVLICDSRPCFLFLFNNLEKVSCFHGVFKESWQVLCSICSARPAEMDGQGGARLLAAAQLLFSKMSIQCNKRCTVLPSAMGTTAGGGGRAGKHRCHHRGRGIAGY